jgi:hypothetical protein
VTETVIEQDADAGLSAVDDRLVGSLVEQAP